jgi:hypothetical protein
MHVIHSHSMAFEMEGNNPVTYRRCKSSEAVRSARTHPSHSGRLGRVGGGGGCDACVIISTPLFCQKTERQKQAHPEPLLPVLVLLLAGPRARVGVGYYESPRVPFCRPLSLFPTCLLVPVQVNTRRSVLPRRCKRLFASFRCVLRTHQSLLTTTRPPSASHSFFVYT